MLAQTKIIQGQGIAENSPARAKAVSAEPSIEGFVEKWRRAWEEGNLTSYLACYHPEFEADDMDHNKWESYKRDLFKRSAKRNIQISDVKIEDKGSSAVVTFKQRYRTAKHQDIGLKTLHLRHYQDSWTILKETWQPLSGQG